MNVTGLLAISLLVATTLWISEQWGKKGLEQALLSRKLLHVVGIGSLAVSPLFIPNYITLAVVAAGLSILLFILVKKRLLTVDIYNRPSWGIALFPVSFLVLWLYWGRDSQLMVVLPMMVLTLADAGAAIAGGIWAKSRYNLTGDEKSILGNVVFAFIAFTCLWVIPPLWQLLAQHPDSGFQQLLNITWSEKLIIFLAIALFTTVAECTTSGGWDNVTIPISVAWLLAVLPGFGKIEIFATLPILAFFAFFAWYTYKNGWLDKGGATTAGLLGFIIWVGGNWGCVVLIGLFFISGSLLGKLKHGRQAISDEKKGKPRDYMQVLCNGGVAGACLIFASLDFTQTGLLLFAISVANSTADTWSSEIGTRWGGRVVNIIGFKSVTRGVSGGITWQGTLAGLMGAFFIGLIAWILKFDHFVWIIGGGFAGMILDSVMGSLLQAGYKINGKWSDVPLEKGKYFPDKGFIWMTNDLVNLYSNLIITLFLALIFHFMWKGG